jgi:hypothetical protein
MRSVVRFCCEQTGPLIGCTGGFVPRSTTGAPTQQRRAGLPSSHRHLCFAGSAGRFLVLLSPAVNADKLHSHALDLRLFFGSHALLGESFALGVGVSLSLYPEPISPYGRSSDFPGLVSRLFSFPAQRDAGGVPFAGKAEEMLEQILLGSKSAAVPHACDGPLSPSR